ncbi:MAG: RHS repeat-associated core domain-containing protein [Candidatus Bathyarchaeia archaeon]
MGSTKALTDANQNTQASYKYDAWGNTLQTSGTITNPYLYVGELGYYSDGDSGMYLLTQRWYNSVVGRFVVRDPVRTNVGVQSTTANLYLYVLMNPTKFTDPSGKRISIDNCGAHKAEVEVAIKVICKLLPKRASCIINCVPPAWPGSFSPVNSGIQLLYCLQDCCKWGKVICNVNHPNCSQQAPTGFPCGFSNCDATKGPLVSVEMCVLTFAPYNLITLGVVSNFMEL